MRQARAPALPRRSLRFLPLLDQVLSHRGHSLRQKLWAAPWVLRPAVLHIPLLTTGVLCSPARKMLPNPTSATEPPRAHASSQLRELAVSPATAEIRAVSPPLPHDRAGPAVQGRASHAAPSLPYATPRRHRPSVLSGLSVPCALVCWLMSPLRRPERSRLIQFPGTQMLEMRKVDRVTERLPRFQRGGCRIVRKPSPPDMSAMMSPGRSAL